MVMCSIPKKGTLMASLKLVINNVQSDFQSSVLILLYAVCEVRLTLLSEE